MSKQRTKGAGGDPALDPAADPTIGDPLAIVARYEARDTELRRQLDELNRQPTTLAEWRADLEAKVEAEGRRPWNGPPDAYRLACSLPTSRAELVDRETAIEVERRKSAGLGEGIEAADRAAMRERIEAERFQCSLEIVRAVDAIRARGIRGAVLMPATISADAGLFGQRVDALTLTSELEATGRRRYAEQHEQTDSLLANAGAAQDRKIGAKEVLEEMRRHRDRIAAKLGHFPQSRVAYSEFMYGDGVNIASPRGQRIAPEFLKQIEEQEADLKRLTEEHEYASSRSRQAATLLGVYRKRLLELGVNPDRPTGVRQVTSAHDAESWVWKDRLGGERRYNEQ